MESFRRNLMKKIGESSCLFYIFDIFHKTKSSSINYAYSKLGSRNSYHDHAPQKYFVLFSIRCSDIESFLECIVPNVLTISSVYFSLPIQK